MRHLLRLCPSSGDRPGGLGLRGTGGLARGISAYAIDRGARSGVRGSVAAVVGMAGGAAGVTSEAAGAGVGAGTGAAADMGAGLTGAVAGADADVPFRFSDEALPASAFRM